MRIRKRWVVLRFHAAREPFDFVEKVSVHYTKRGAEKRRRWWGPNLKEFVNQTHPSFVSKPDSLQFYYGVMKFPKRTKFKYERPVPET